MYNPENKEIAREIIEIDLLINNEGQVPGLPQNPRFIKDKEFQNLIASIKEDPDFLNVRELIVYPWGDAFIVLGGNQRLRACREIGFDVLPCKVMPITTPIEKLKRIVIKDNGQHGENDYDLLASDWADLPLDEYGLKIPEDWLKEPEQDDEELPDLSDKLKTDFKVEITCISEEEQAALFNELQERGYDCKILSL